MQVSAQLLHDQCVVKMSSAIGPCHQFVANNLQFQQQPVLSEYSNIVLLANIKIIYVHSDAILWANITIICNLFQVLDALFGNKKCLVGAQFCLPHYFMILFRLILFVCIFKEASKVLGFHTTTNMALNFSHLFLYFLSPLPLPPPSLIL